MRKRINTKVMYVEYIDENREKEYYVYADNKCLIFTYKHKFTNRRDKWKFTLAKQPRGETNLAHLK